MRLIRGLHNIPNALSESAIALGDFDGVHLGHQKIIYRLIQEAKENRLTSILICFEPQPAEFLYKDAFEGRISRLREKCRVLKNFDIDYLLCLAFNKKLSSLSVSSFVKNILVDRLHCRRLIVGDDFRLGKNRQGCVDRLRELGQAYGFVVIAEKTFKINDKRDSSTRIRKALKKGDFDLVKHLMGREYSITGRVRFGDGRGKKLGYPTANIPLFHYRMAASGIFIVKVRFNKHQKYGVANLGIRPTFHEHQFVLEVYLLDFEGDLYGKTLEVEFLYKIRDEKFFKSIDELIIQMQKDVEFAEQWILSQSSGSDSSAK